MTSSGCSTFFLHPDLLACPTNQLLHSSVSSEGEHPMEQTFSDFFGVSMHTTTYKASHRDSKPPKLRGLGKIWSHPISLESSSVSGALRWVWLIRALQGDREVWGWGIKTKEAAHSSGGRAYQGLSPVLTLNHFGFHLCTKSSNTIRAGFDPSRAKT